jgi:SNF2 family DNA or RNA helicase
MASRCELELLLLPYSMLIKYIDELEEIRWNIIVMDEGHVVKNDRTVLYKACMKLTHARSRIVLSGTPIQNKLGELWSLLSVITNPMGWMDKSSFEDRYEKPIALSKSYKASLEAARIGQVREEELRVIVRKYYISRKKESLSGDSALKGKEDYIILCDLSDLQKRMYQYVLSLPDFDNIRRQYEPCACPNGRRMSLQRKDCCIECSVPYIRVKSNSASTEGQAKPKKYYTIDQRAVIWRQLHPVFYLCGHWINSMLLTLN